MSTLSWTSATNLGAAVSPPEYASLTGAGIAVDVAGDLFVVGEIGGKQYVGGKLVDPTGPYPYNGYVARMSPQGQASWVRLVSGAQSLSGVALDTAGRLFVSGSFLDLFNYDGLNLAAMPASGPDNFLLRALAANGAAQWVHNYGSLSAVPGGVFDSTTRPAVEPKGSKVMVGGRFSKTALFGLNLVQRTTSDLANGYIAAFQGATPNASWVDVVGSSVSDDEITDVAYLPKTGGVVACGSFEGVVQFVIPGVPVQILLRKTTADRCALVVTTDSNGTVKWVSAPTTKPDGVGVSTGTCVVSGGPQGRVVLGGYFQLGSMELPNLIFGDSPISTTLRAGFVICYTPSGVPLWMRKIQDPLQLAQVTSVAIDDANNVYAAGVFRSSAQLGPFSVLNPRADNLAVFIAKFDPNGVPLALTACTPTTSSELWSTAGLNYQARIVLHQDALYLCTTFGGTVQCGGTVLTANALSNALIARLD